MNQGQLEGIARGNKRADDAANRAGKQWQAEAFSHLVSYAKRFGRFQAAQARIYSVMHGMEPPPDNRAWGSIVTSAARRGLIKKVDIQPVSTPGSHGRPMWVWQWVGKQ